MIPGANFRTIATVEMRDARVHSIALGTRVARDRSDIAETRGARGKLHLGLSVLIAAGVLLLAAAVAVRGITPARLALPKDATSDRPRIAEPMQLLARGAPLRAPELDALVDASRAKAFKSTRQTLFRLAGCPPLVEWIDRADGQALERMLGELRSGTREEAFASLALVFQLARATQWRPGVMGHSEHAEKLGGLLQDWLRVWGERGARDPLLSEPALAATLFYGRVMRTAWRAPIVGYNAAPYDRATLFLGELTGLRDARHTALGEALQARYARGASRLRSDKDALSGLEEECAVLFPDLTGDCSR
jgi:hypothetical protein